MARPRIFYGSFSLVVSLFLFGAFMPLVGRLVGRVGSRLVVTGGVLILPSAAMARPVPVGSD